MVSVTTHYNLSSLLESGATAHPDRDAVVAGDTRLSYAQVNAMACQVAGMLAAKGIKPADKVALSCPNIPHFTIAYFGILKAGATVVPLNVLLKAREIAYHLNDCDAKAYLCFEGTPELPMAQAGHAGFTQAPNCEHFIVITVDPAAPSPVGGSQTLAAAIAGRPPAFGTQQTGEDDTAVILYTSGTTGQPKGAELRHRNLRDNVLVGAQIMGASAEHPDTSLAVLPLFHSFGQTAVQNGTLCYGGTLIMLPRFEPLAALRLMQQEKVTHFAGVPTMYWGLLNALDEAGDEIDVAALKQNIRVAVSGGSALPVEIHKAFQARFGVTILEGYGLSETSPVASFSILGEPPRPGSIGVPIPGVEMDLVVPDTWTPIEWTPEAVGEIVIRGTNVMKGYYNRPAATAAVISPDGWFRSGDLARRDADGWYYIVDRTKDLIIRGGFNVYPREVEEVLMTHPAVSLAAVIGVPDDVHGEEVKAFVILKPGATATPGELVSWSRENMAAYKYPRTVQIADTLPMTATGKILKRELGLSPAAQEGRLDDGVADDAEAVFLAERRRLFGLAYRMLGSASDAEDVLQSAFEKWLAADAGSIAEPAAWLTTVVTNLCLRLLGSVRRQRELYPGTWLPEPVLTSDGTLGPADAAQQRESVSFGLLVLMERLTAPERAVFVLREAFGYQYARIAAILGRTEEACRQLQRRARQRIGMPPRFEPETQRWRELTVRFFAAADDGDLAGMERLLAADVTVWSDGEGSDFPFARKPVVGRARVAGFFAWLHRRNVGVMRLSMTEANAQPAALVWRDNALFAVLIPEFRELGELGGPGGSGKPGEAVIAAIRLVLNPAKLAFAARQTLSRNGGADDQ